jgi:hypothetical protein
MLVILTKNNVPLWLDEKNDENTFLRPLLKLPADDLLQA